MTKHPDTQRSRLTRRGLVLGAVACAAGAGVFAGRWFNVTAQVTGGTLSVEAAHEAALRGDVLLVDIRRPDEWTRTGLAAGAHPVDMRRPDFTEALLELSGGDRSTAIAVICARGVRSRHMTAQLTDAGFTYILDVPEGMLGSGAGEGWLRKGLPVVVWNGTDS